MLWCSEMLVEYGKMAGRTSGRVAAEGANCTSGRNGGNKINAVEGVMLFFGYTVGNIINIPSFPCYYYASVLYLFYRKSVRLLGRYLLL